MKVRLKKNYKIRGDDHYIPKGKLIELYESFEVFGKTFYNTNLGFRINCSNFDEFFVVVGE